MEGVSGFQLNFSQSDILTPGDLVITLVVMNPAALKTNIEDLLNGGSIIANEDEFTDRNLAKAGYQSNPLEDGSLRGLQLYGIPISTMTREAVKVLELPPKVVDRCRNFFALGLVCWLYDRPTIEAIDWLEEKFRSQPVILDANLRAMQAGFHFGATTEMFAVHYHVDRASLPPGEYRNLTGNEAMSTGLTTATRLAGKDLLYASYPITPASDILHALSRHKHFGIKTFQAEDEIAAMSAAIGASFGGAIGVTGTSGPGLALKAEAIGLAVMTELPVVVIDVQRAGPCTGMPTKTEQSDLLQALCGRNGESPVVVLAPNTPSDCFRIAIEAVRIAVKYMTPVLVLSDSYLANGSEPWLIPDPERLPKIPVSHPKKNGKFHPYARNEWLARPWAIPGTSGLEHRIGGLEKEDVTGNVSCDPENHQRMVEIRAAKIANVAREIPETTIHGDRTGTVLVLGWGSTYGAIRAAISRLREEGHPVSGMHLRYLNPLPPDLGEVFAGFDKVLVPELNMGQLLQIIRANYVVDAVGLHKVQGRPFMIQEIVQAAKGLISEVSP